MRLAMQGAPPQVAPSPAAPVSVTPASAPDVRLEYVRRSSLRVRGAASGRTYAFDAATRVQPVLAGDVAALVRSGLFRVSAR